MALGKEPPPHWGEGTRGAVPCEFRPAQVLPRGPGATRRTLPQPRGRASRCPKHGAPRRPQRARLPSSRPLLSPGRRATCERGGAWRSRAPAPGTKAEPAGAAKPRGHAAAGGRSAGEAPPAPSSSGWAAPEGGAEQPRASPSHPRGTGPPRSPSPSQPPSPDRVPRGRIRTSQTPAGPAPPPPPAARPEPHPSPRARRCRERGHSCRSAPGLAQHQASLQQPPGSPEEPRGGQVQPQAVQGFGAQPRPHLYSHPTVQLLF